jgi:hypothetical protein
MDVAVGRIVTVRRTAGTGGIAGVQGPPGKIVAVETETAPTVVRLAGRSTECSAVEFLRPIEVVGLQRHMRNSHQPTPFRSAEP